MYINQYPFYNKNINVRQIPPYFINLESPEMVSSQVSPEQAMPEYQLENMYPNVYFIIYPEVVRHCDDFDRACCCMNLPTRDEIERMVDNITMKVQPEVEAAIEPEMRDVETRQLGFAGRGLLRNLVGVLLLREFFDRRHRPHRRRRMGY